MERNDWTRISELFETARGLPPEARANFLDRLGAGAVDLRRELETLLSASDQSKGFLEEPPLRLIESDESEQWLPSGTALGRWRILRLVGRGGMSEVYEAERASGDFEQRAAVKVTQAKIADAQLERFNAERQLLARFDHPGIARVLDGGLASDGRPFFVMEYIDGLAIDSYCDAESAPLLRRLQLFLQVCDAVAYAHRHLVVHRDIKPANVLIDRDGRARLLDFGIAKPLDIGLRQNGAAPLSTLTLLTPEYAAPEQLAGEPVTTATDVYALGVLLFELLTGRRPWLLESQPLFRVMQTVLERSAPRPSETARETPTRPIASRALEGDLDAIIAKCLRREPNHRYVTVEALKLDIERSLRKEPVCARGDAPLYTLGRFIRRHRWAVASGMTIALLLIGGIVTTTWQARRAEREAARATAVRDFLIGVFKASDPRVAQDKPRGQITARELLDASVDRIDRRFAGDPPTRIELLGTATDIYRELDEEERYQELHRRHLAEARRHYGDQHPIVLSALMDEVERANDRVDRKRALQLLDELDAQIRRADRDRSALRARWWLGRGQALMGDGARKDEQIAALRKAADLLAEVSPTNPKRVTALADIGTVYANHLDYDAAQTFYEQATAVAETVENRNDAELSTIYGNMGLAALSTGDFGKAERSYARAEQIILRTYGKRHLSHWLHAANRARAAHLGGDREHAQMLFADLLENIPADSVEHQAMQAREIYAGCLAAEGRPLEAIPLLRQVEQFDQRTPAYDFELPRVHLTLGDAYDRAGLHAEARATLEAALAERANLPPESQPVLAVHERLGRLLVSQGDISAAEARFQEVVRQARGRALSHIALAHGGLARVALARGDVPSALTASANAIDLFERVSGFRDVRMGPYLWLIRSEVLRHSGDNKGGAQWAQRALDASRRFDAPGAASIAEAQAALRVSYFEADSR